MVAVGTNRTSLVKISAILGFVLAEIYMFFTVASPRLQGVEIPVSSIILRVCALFFLFGPFGLAVGTGTGLLLDGLWKLLFRRASDSESGRPPADNPRQLAEGAPPVPIEGPGDAPTSLPASVARPPGAPPRSEP